MILLVKNSKLISLFIFFCLNSIQMKSQIVCVYSFNQNNSYSTNVSNFIRNGSFENTTCQDPSNDIFCPNSQQYNCDIDQWTCRGGGNLTYCSIFDSIRSLIPDGNNAVYFGNAFSNICSTILGDTSCLVFTDPIYNMPPPGFPNSDYSHFGGTTGIELEQVVTGLTPAGKYVLEFWAGGESEFGYFTNSDLFAVDVGFGNIYLRCQPTMSNLNSIGTNFLLVFNAQSSVDTIRFTNWGHMCNTCTELVLDNVKLYSFEELATTLPNCSVSIEDPTNEFQVNIYPNPLQNTLEIETNNFEQVEVVFYDITSREIFRSRFIGSVNINTKGFQSGQYIYKIFKNDDLLKVGRVIKT